MRLLILTPEYSGAGGGIITFYRALVPALRQAGITVKILEGSAANASAEKHHALNDEVDVEWLERDRFHSWNERFANFALVPQLRRHLAAAWAMWEQAGKGEGFDVIEACDWGLLFAPAALEASRPLIVQCHGSIGQIAVHDPIAGDEVESALIRLIERELMRNAGKLQTCSHANAAFWRAETGREVEVLRPAWQSPYAAPADMGLAEFGVVVGRLQRWKGPHVLCDALRRLGNQEFRVEWFGRDTVWQGRANKTSSHLARTYPDVWGKRLHHRSHISPEEVAWLQASARLNIVPSTWDVFNFTLVESMASGRPTVASTGAGASELIQDGQNGFLFDKGDAEALATALDRALSASPSKAQEIGRAAQETVRTLLDPYTIVSQRMVAYRAAIDAFRSQPPAAAHGSILEVCRPTATPGDEHAFLERVPLRSLATHTLSRMRQRLS